MIQPRRRRVRNEELRSIGVRPRICHRHHARLVVQQIGMELIPKPVSGPPGTCSRRIATLCHEAFDDAVEHGAVIESLARQEYDGAAGRVVSPGFLQPAVEVIAGRFPLRDFLGVLTAGDLLIGPSTGPLHIAAALGLAVVGLYPPIPTQSIARWGPLGRCSHGLAPDVPCPAHRICFGERCRHWNCMVDVAEREVVAAATAALRDRRRQRSDTP